MGFGGFTSTGIQENDIAGVCVHVSYSTLCIQESSSNALTIVADDDDRLVVVVVVSDVELGYGYTV